MKILKVLLLALLMQTSCHAGLLAKQQQKKPQVSYFQRVKNALLSKNGLLVLSVGTNICLALYARELLQRYPGLGELPKLREQAGHMPGLKNTVSILEGLNRALDEQVKESNLDATYHEGMHNLSEKRRESAILRAEDAQRAQLEAEGDANRVRRSARRLGGAHTRQLKKPASGPGGRRDMTVPVQVIVEVSDNGLVVSDEKKQ